jgi:hypothetical protein
MILIDRNKLFQNIFLTLTESTTVSNPVYSMRLKHDATRSEYTLNLSENQSTATQRYDLFQVFTTEFEGFENGYYSFEVFQNETDTDSIEDGKLLIKNTQVIAADDQYIVYQL